MNLTLEARNSTGMLRLFKTVKACKKLDSCWKKSLNKKFYETVNDFHPYPDSSKTGTVLLLIDETMNLGEFKEYQRKQGLSKDEKKALKEKEKQHKLKEKEKRRKERLKEKKKLKKMRDAGIMDIGSDLKNNHHIGRIEQTISQFSTDWKNVDEYLNKEHVAIKEWVTENELATIHKELRALVDKYMIVEYDLLKEAWCTDNKKPFKPLAKSTDKDSLKKKKKLKRTHDLTEGRTIESLYEELKTAEIIEDYPVKLFEDYLGDINVLADDTRGENIFTSSNPAKADIKMVIQDYLFGMGAFNVEQTKSLCLVGPESNGKKLLCYIIASELGALFIDLSPEKTFRFQEDLKYLIHIVMKVAKALQPTILFIEDAHRVFWKKVPKEQMDILPTLLNNSLRNIIKLIGKKDKIMLMGTSSLPWSANPTFQKLFNTFLLVPESDYGTIFLMWLELLTQNVNSIYFDDSIISVLAKVFQKYHTGDISDNVANSLNISRRLRLHSTPLNPNEFLEYFLSKSKPLFPPEPKILEKYQQWYNKANKYAKSRVNKIAEMNKPKK